MKSPSDEIDKVFEQTLAGGGIVVKQRLVNQRVAPNPMETRGVVADYNKANKSLTVWCSSQNPHILRNILAAAIGHPQHQVRVIVPEVCGAFRCKIYIYPEEMIPSFASMKLGRSVKWNENHTRNLAFTIHGRDQTDYV